MLQIISSFSYAAERAQAILGIRKVQSSVQYTARILCIQMLFLHSAYIIQIQRFIYKIIIYTTRAMRLPRPIHFQAILIWQDLNFTEVSWKHKMKGIELCVFWDRSILYLLFGYL
jgi:hypothetical protein